MVADAPAKQRNHRTRPRPGPDAPRLPPFAGTSWVLNQEINRQDAKIAKEDRHAGLTTEGTENTEKKRMQTG